MKRVDGGVALDLRALIYRPAFFVPAKSGKGEGGSEKGEAEEGSDYPARAASLTRSSARRTCDSVV
jgi:hypothetical protein